MYRTGHYGMSLLVFAPVGFALAAAGRPALALVTAGTMVSLATLPDVDHRLPGVTHRGATHTLAFAAAVGTALALVGRLVSPDAVSLRPVAAPVGRAGVVAYGFALGTVSVGAHLLADLLTPAAVAPFWPLSGRRYSLSLTAADDRVWNYGLLGAGVLAAGAALLGGAGV